METLKMVFKTVGIIVVRSLILGILENIDNTYKYNQWQEQTYDTLTTVQANMNGGMYVKQAK